MKIAKNTNAVRFRTIAPVLALVLLVGCGGQPQQPQLVTTQSHGDKSEKAGGWQQPVTQVPSRPAVLSGLLDRSRKLMGGERWSDAGALLQRAQRLAPYDAEVYVLLAKLRLQQHQPAAARSFLAKARTLVHQGANLSEEIAQLELRLND